jgi:hypothetical protein
MSLRDIPPAVRFMVVHGVVGFGLATAFVAAVLWSDPGGAGSLILRVGGWPVVLMLWYFCGLTFGGVQIAAAVMLQDGRDEQPRGGRRLRVPAALAPVRVAARRRG